MHSAQGIVGETYARMLAGAKAVSDPEHPLYIADDFQFHGAHGAEEYAMAGYFDEGHALSLFGKKVAASSRRMLIEGAAGKVMRLSLGPCPHAIALKMVLAGVLHGLLLVHCIDLSSAGHALC